MRTCALFRIVVATSVAASAAAAPDPPSAGYTLAEVTASLDASAIEGVTQLAFMPGDDVHVFAARSYTNVVTRYAYDAVTGAFTNPVDVATSLVFPIGLAFHGADLYVTANANGNGGIMRLRDMDGDDIFEETSLFVSDIPRGNHHVNQLQISGNTLVTSIGMASNSGHPDCENVYTGTIARISDLTLSDHTGANNLASESDFVIGTPADGLLRRYASGFRNAYGVRVRVDGSIWLTDNGARACASCCAGNELPSDTEDLFYREVELDDEGAFPPAGLPGGSLAPISPFAAFPPHWATTGFDFFPMGGNAGDVLVAIYGPTIETKPGGRNLVRVDATTGAWEVFIDGFNRPIDVLADPFGRMLIADREEKAVYLLTPDGTTPVDDLPTSAGVGRHSLALEIKPNPFASHATFHLLLPSAGSAALAIYDAVGREVHAVPARRYGPGAHRIGWDATSTEGRALAPGVYFAHLTSAFGSQSVRLVKLP